MRTIKIGDGDEKDLNDVTSNWITDQVNRRLRDDIPVCVIVTIKEGDVNVKLVTPACRVGRGVGPGPNDHEKAIFDLWEKLHLGERSFSAGNVVAFVKQVGKLL